MENREKKAPVGVWEELELDLSDAQPQIVFRSEQEEAGSHRSSVGEAAAHTSRKKRLFLQTEQSAAAQDADSARDSELVFSGRFAVQVSRPVLNLNNRKKQKARREPQTFSQRESKIIRVRTDGEPAHQHQQSLLTVKTSPSSSADVETTNDLLCLQQNNFSVVLVCEISERQTQTLSCRQIEPQMGCPAGLRTSVVTSHAACHSIIFYSK